MEIWKAVPGFEGRYEVSSIGRVRSVSRSEVTSAGRSRYFAGKVLKPQKARNGYLLVSLGRRHKHVLVHRLVASAFLPADPVRTEVNHKNLIKTDNRVTNLEWTTKSENLRHAYGNGAMPYEVWRRPLRCVETGEVFQSSYCAAEWLNEHVYQFSGNVANIASNIRTAARKGCGVRGYHWAKVEEKPSTTIPKGSTPKRVEMGSPS